jgi:hypothetical protein
MFEPKFVKKSFKLSIFFGYWHTNQSFYIFSFKNSIFDFRKIIIIIKIKINKC